MHRALAVTRDYLWGLQTSGLIRRNRHDGSDPQRIPVEVDLDLVIPKFLHQASEETLWLGAEGGVLLLLNQNGDTLDAWQAGAEPPRNLPTLTPKMIRRGPDGRMWLLGGTQLYRQRADGSFEAMLPEHGLTLLHMLFDDDTLWLASDSTLERFRVAPTGLQQEARWTDRDATSTTST